MFQATELLLFDITETPSDTDPKKKKKKRDDDPDRKKKKKDKKKKKVRKSIKNQLIHKVASQALLWALMQLWAEMEGHSHTKPIPKVYYLKMYN